MKRGESCATPHQVFRWSWSPTSERLFTTHNEPSFCRVVLGRFMFVHTSICWGDARRCCAGPFPSSKVAQHKIMDFLWLFTLASRAVANALTQWNCISCPFSWGKHDFKYISSERLMAFCDGECAVALLMIPAWAQIIVLKTNCAIVNAIFIFFNRL